MEGFAALGACGGTGAALRVTGRIVESPGREQATEMQAVAVDVVGTVAVDVYPLAKKSHSKEFLRSIGHLRPRTAFIGAVHRVRNACAYASHRFFQDRGFQYVQTPLITTADCEGAGEMFSVTNLLPHDPKVRGPARAKCPRPGTHPTLTPRALAGRLGARRERRRRLHPRLLPPARLPHRVRSAQRGGVLLRAGRRVHVRADVPRGAVAHHAPPGRVLDD